MTIITSLFLNKKRVSWIKRILRIKLQIKLDLVIKGRSQYLSCRLQMDRLSIYFSCAVFVISLLAVIYLSNSSVFLITNCCNELIHIKGSILSLGLQT